MKIRTKVVNAAGEEIAPEDVTAKAPEKIAVVYAHTDEVNDNGLKLNADSLIVTRDKYPLLYEHSDNSIDNVVGYVETDGKPNGKGEFVGYITFYDTPNGQHARQLWEDGVLDELSVAYFVEEAEKIDNLDNDYYLNILKATLKEISLVSVGADRKTGAVDELSEDSDDTDEPDETPEEDKEEPSENSEDSEESTEDDDEEDDVLHNAKLNFFKTALDN
jgi:caudovirus prohead protease|nr:MAG TPA: prohead protease [Caudoviricetes sp.]